MESLFWCTTAIVEWEMDMGIVDLNQFLEWTNTILAHISSSMKFEEYAVKNEKLLNADMVRG